ncbi:MAG: TatD family hydrolase [Alistipes sp.]|nr:TatD family hydrolase [Alistipes sp.]
MLIDIHTHHPTSAVTITAVGLHPWQAEHGAVPSEEQIEAADAVGEIGLDKACEVDFERQTAMFEAQLRLAEQHKKPVVVHCVRAFEEVMNALEKFALRTVIFHGFIGSSEQAERAVKKGYYLSFGARTERSKKSIEALRATPLDRLFIESDEAETPIAEIYALVARLRGLEVEELAAEVSQNYERIFSRKDE